ncbi:6-phosphogluconolactonase [Aliikangiella sp. IMCC44359]|uniref:6-phosphogluconolactonase n=1 Tax=Aliikangiella sp. IMCC44359 TaxID=3459125 RepID=UPI00403AE474
MYESKKQSALEQEPIERFFSSQDELHHSLFANTHYQLEKAIQTRGKATFMVSGGSTPLPLYRSLSKAPLAWHKIDVGLVDERWVSPLDAKSNEKSIRQNLIVNNAANANFITMKTDATTADIAQLEVNQEYKKLDSPYDVTILGMGKDGHIASLFPNADGLKNALNNTNLLCCAIKAKQSEVTGEQTERMSLTLNALKNSRLIKLIITGKEKLEVYQKAFSGNDHASLPIRSIIQQTSTPVVVYWAP